MKSHDLSSVKWRDVWSSSRSRVLLFFCLIAILVLVIYLPVFYKEILEPKPGIIWQDAVLNMFSPVNWSIPIFSIIYLTILQTFLSIVRQPDEILLTLSTYLAVNLLRMVSMYLLTFEPPADMILLVDPVTSHFYPDGGFAKDLFFSGHVSTMTLMVLAEKKKGLRLVKMGLTFLVALFLIWQHVHFTLDILVAPIVVGVIYHSFRTFQKASPGT